MRSKDLTCEQNPTGSHINGVGLKFNNLDKNIIRTEQCKPLSGGPTSPWLGPHKRSLMWRAGGLAELIHGYCKIRKPGKRQIVTNFLSEILFPFVRTSHASFIALSLITMASSSLGCFCRHSTYCLSETYTLCVALSLYPWIRLGTHLHIFSTILVCHNLRSNTNSKMISTEITVYKLRNCFSQCKFHQSNSVMPSIQTVL